MKLLSFFGAALLAALPSLATGDAQIWQGTVFSSMKPGKNDPQGCVTGTISGQTIDGGIYAGLIFQPIEYAKTLGRMSTVMFSSTQARHDLKDEKRAVDAFRFCVKPGRYALKQVRFGNSFSVTDKHGVSPFEVPFDVPLGGDIYIGSFDAYSGRNPEKLCRSGGRGLHFTIADRSARDVPMIMAMKKPSATTPRIAVLDVAVAAPYIFPCID